MVTSAPSSTPESIAGLVGPAQVEEPAGLGQEAGVGILGVEADLDGVAGRDDVFLSQRQGFAHGHPELELDEVEAGHHLGDGVLDLEPGVHLDEPEGLSVVVDEELAGAGIAVADVAAQRDGGAGQLFPQCGPHDRRRRLLQDLLVAALQGAVPLAEVDDVAERVGHHLHLDMAGGRQVALQDAAWCRRRRRPPPGGPRPGRGSGRLGADDRHALAAPAGGGLHDQRVADLLGRPFEGGVVLVGAAVAGQGGDAGRLGDALRFVLAAHGGEDVGGRADEGVAGRFHRPSEAGVLGQEAEAGMDQIGLERLGRFENFLRPQIRLAAGAGPMQ